MFAAWWSRAFRPPRTIWPTREGWWLLFAAVGLGFAAMNTGNNLLYLLVSMLLGLIVVSGILSERSMRGLRISMTMPGEIFAGRPAFFGAAVVNRKPWAASYSITLEILGREARPRLLYVPRLASGAEHFFTWEDVLPRRGRQQLAGVRITTRFPFGLFLKAGRAVVGPDVVVYPSVGAISLERVALLGIGETVSRRGRASDLYNLREYRWGDDPDYSRWRLRVASRCVGFSLYVSPSPRPGGSEREQADSRRSPVSPGSRASCDAQRFGFQACSFSLAFTLTTLAPRIEPRLLL